MSRGGREEKKRIVSYLNNKCEYEQITKGQFGEILRKVKWLKLHRAF